MKMLENITKHASKMYKARGAYKQAKAAAAATKLNAKANYQKALGKKKMMATMVNSIVAGEAAKKEAEEKTKRIEASNRLAVQKAALAKWNDAINMDSDPAEGTGTYSPGQTGVTPIGMEG